MSDENSEGSGEGSGEGSEKLVTYTEKEYKLLVDDNSKMKKHMDDLLTETKLAKIAKKEAVETARIASDAKAKKDGDYEQLYNSSQKESEGLKIELGDLRTGISKQKAKNEAMRIAGSIAEGSNAEILSDIIVKRIKATEDGIQVLDASGQLTVSTVEDLQNEFKNNARFASLLTGNQSDGGGAPGGKSGGATGKIINRAEFDKIPGEKRGEFFKKGGKLID